MRRDGSRHVSLRNRWFLQRIVVYPLKEWDDWPPIPCLGSMGLHRSTCVCAGKVRVYAEWEVAYFSPFLSRKGVLGWLGKDTQVFVSQVVSFSYAFWNLFKSFELA